MAITSSLGWLSSQKARRQQPFPSAILIVFVNWIVLFFHLNLRYLFSNQITLDSSWKNWVGFRWASHFHAIAFLINIKNYYCWRKWFYFLAPLTLFRFFMNNTIVDGNDIAFSLSWFTIKIVLKQYSFPSAMQLLWFNWKVLFFYSNLRYLLSKQMTLGSS